MYQPYSASPYQPQPQDATFARGASPTDPGTAAAAKEQKYKVCGSPSVVAGAPTPPGHPEEEAAGSSQQNVKFLTSNCVLVTNYCGDAANVVDEHFARALSHNTGFEQKHGAATGKDSVPMTQRNLPASFWNSTYHSRSTVTSLGHGGGHDLYSDPYHSSALHGLHQSADPWHYALATQAAGYPGGYGGATAGVAAAAARFNSYNPLLFPGGSRLPAAGQPSKSDWAGRGYPDVGGELAGHPHPHSVHPHSVHPHPLDPGFGAGAVGYGNVVTGLESSLHAAAGGKDSYWL